ncbi:MAG: PAS domain-containing protein [Proteobacteria bacterium]|nr:PAS domain-containing protein [Pseudomonadota bacterium]
MKVEDRLPIATAPIGRIRVAVYCAFVALLSVGLALTADKLSPIVLAALFAVLLALIGVFLLVPRRWQTRAYARWRDVMPCHLSVLNRDLRIIDVNDLFKRDFGDRLGEYCFKVYKKREEPCPHCPVVATFNDGKVHKSEEIVVTGSGENADMVVTSAPLLDDQNDVVAVVLMSTDITEMRTMARELEKSRRDYKQLFSAVPCYICVLSKDLEILESNSLYRNDFDTSQGSHCFEVCKNKKFACPDCLVQKTFKDGNLHSSEETLITRDGRQLSLIVYSMPLRDDSGEITAVMEVFTDITEVKRLQRQLTLMGRAVTGMAHRIKNILMGLEGSIFVVNTGREMKDREMMVEGWEMVERNVGRVSRLVMDLLFCSKKRAPEFNKDICPQEITREVADLYRKRMADEGIELRLELSEPPYHGTFDPDSLHGMLSNLTANAIDACRFDLDENKSSHTITLRCTTDEAGTTILEVEDDGAGIPNDVSDKVFEDFFSTKGTEGTGVGLLVVQKVAEEHGGSVSFNTEPGHGTTFRVTIPPQAEN